jgi:hypothetical protein
MTMRMTMAHEPGPSQPVCPECGDRFMLDLMGQVIGKRLGADGTEVRVISTPCCGVFLELPIEEDLPRVALSLRQPWAWMVTRGSKDVENRVWRRVRLGRFLIHASKAMTRREYDEAVAFAAAVSDDVIPPREELQFGGIVGVATHVGQPLMPAFSRQRWHMSGQYGYVLKDRKALPFVGCRGHLGTWAVPDEVIEEIEALVRAQPLRQVL